jgi:hypothetical protein
VTAGEVSLAQAAEITSVPEHETELLELARESGLRAVKDTARRRRVEGIDPEELHAKQHAAREFVHWKDELGMIRFRGALPPVHGVSFISRLDAQTDREWRTARRVKRTEPRAALAADAFLHMVEGGGRGKATSADVVFVIDERAYRRGHAHPGEPCHILGGGPIPVSAVRERVDDAFVKALLHDGVMIKTVSHPGRRRSAELNTALELGAAPHFLGVTCTVPGCHRTYGLQWDHKDPCANGGGTTFENLQPLCTPHHCEKTENDRRAGLLTGSKDERGP